MSSRIAMRQTARVLVTALGLAAACATSSNAKLQTTSGPVQRFSLGYHFG